MEVQGKGHLNLDFWYKVRIVCLPHLNGRLTKYRKKKEDTNFSAAYLFWVGIYSP